MADSPIDQQWEAIRNRVTEAITNNFPMEGKKNKLVLNGPLTIDDKIVDHANLKSQEEAKLNGRTWGAPVYADISLIDKVTGEQLDRSRIKLMTLPKPTQRYSYIVEGNEWQVDNLWKLRSGVYAHIKQNGELQAEFNLKKPFAKSPRLFIPFSPEKRQFKLRFESSNFPLYSILKTLGVSDDEMKKEWGDSIYRANIVASTKVEKDINSLYSKLSDRGVRAPGDTLKQKAQAILDTFHSAELIPETTKATLGKPLDHVNGEALLLASKRILEVARGDIPPDDRDSLIFKELHTVDDFLHDTLSKNKTQRTITHRINNNIDRQIKVRDIISGDVFTRPVVEFFSKDTLSRNPEQVNPLEMMSNHRATTIIAPEMGGIKNERSITGEMTLINPSHLGFLDPVHTPECYSEDTEVFTIEGWKKWPDVKNEDLLACRVDSKLKFCHPLELYSSDYKGLMYGALTKKITAKTGTIDYLVTPNHRMYVRPSDPSCLQWRFELAEQVHGRPRTFCAWHNPYEGSVKDPDFDLPFVEGNNSSVIIETIPLLNWAEFMGWYLSEGCTTYNETTSSYLVRISQSADLHPANCQRIENLLRKLPWKWCQDSSRTSYAIGNKQLANYLNTFGYSENKYIPDYFFKASIPVREILLETLLLGDGRKDSHRSSGVFYKQQVFCTSSPKLAEGFERLAISLGFSVKISCYSDKREERYFDIFEVRLLKYKERQVWPKKKQYYVKEYSGKIYCATVPGGLLLVRRNGSVPIWLGNSEKTGITLHLPLGVKKEGNEAKAIAYDLKENKIKYVSAAELHSEHIILPDQVTWKQQKPIPISSTVKMKDPRSNEIVEKPFSTGRYLLLTAHQLFDEATNLIPFLQNNQGNRTMTASRQATQAVGLFHREAPLVQVRSGPGTSWERLIGSAWTHKATTSGKILEIQKNPQNGHPDAIIIQDAAGQNHIHQMYNHFPLNDSKSFMHSIPTVKVGDKVAKGQLIADSNYTRNGDLALGTNLRVTYLPYKGYNFEDGIVISESAAQKLTSEHVHRKSIEVDPDKDSVDKKKFISYASTASKKLSADQLNKLGDDGIIRIGSKVAPGDILVAAIGKRDLVGEAARAVGRLDKKMFSFQDKSILWDSQHEGEVVKVVKNPNGKGATVFIKTLEPAEIGDKMVGRHGNKGIITRILPNSEMPRIGSADGEHTEVLMNPSGVPTRLNLGQMLETASSKIAIKTGKPFMVQNFGGANKDYSEDIKDELKKQGLHDEDDMYDAQTGKKLGSALNGHQYILKLKHQVEKKLAVRGGGNSRYEYSMDRSPKGTGADWPGQAIGQLEFYALLAHGARHNLREMATYKAEQHKGPYNDENEHIDFWQRVQTGQPLPPPRSPFAYKKFEATLTGLGINIKKEGHQLVLQPLTDKGVLSMSAGEILDPGRVLRGKDAKELERGLFDIKVTGGLPNDTGKGLKWSHITLPESLPNPIFVGMKQHPGPAVILSGLKFDEFEQVARGQKTVKVPSGDMKTGGQAINEILGAIQVKPEIAKLRTELQARDSKGNLKLRGTDLDKKNKKLKYLMALDRLGFKPNEAYTMKYIPVLPPIFRPIIPMEDGAFRFDDINHYYKALGHIIKQYKEAPKELGDEGIKELRDELYDVTRSLAGLSGGVPIYDSNREMKGLLDTISGIQPKEGYFQKRLMKRRQDLSMRSTIIPEPAMHLDHVGLPKDAAMELYKPFVVREMQSLGYSPIEALREIKTGSDLSWRTLQSAMDKRPVMLKRDPALHKFSIMAFKPKLMEGKAIKIHPLVTAGYNADFDGNCFLGTSKIVLKFCNKHGTLADITSVEKEFAMKFITGTTIQLGYDNGIIVETEIQQVPYFPETGRLDKNGASVYNVPDGIFVLSYDHDSKIPKFCAVKAITVEGSCETAKIVTRTGFEVTASTNESLCVYDHDTQKIKDICPKDAIGKLSPIVRKIPTSGSYGNCQFGWMLGAFVSDGFINGNTVGISKALDAYRERFFNALAAYEEKFPKRTTFREEHSTENGDDITGISVKDHIYEVPKSVALFEQCFVYPRVEGHSSLSKKLPNLSMLTHEALVGVFLGLIEGDGSLSISHGKTKPQVLANFGTSSIALVESVLTLCKFLGIRASVSHYDPKEGRLQKHRAYIINFSTPDLEKYASTLLSKHCDPAIVGPLQLLIEQGVAKDDRDIVPVPEYIMSLCASTKGPITDKSMQRSLATIKSSRRNGWYVSRDMAKKILEYGNKTSFVTEFNQWASLVYAEDIHWDIITDVTNVGPNTVYDLVVPETKVFAVNGGLIVWDTMSAFVPLTDDAVRETFKMFPSNNLFSSTHGGIMYAPEQEAFLGLHLLSRWGKDTGKTFPNFNEALKAKDRGQLEVIDAITLNGHKTTLGRALIAQHLPDVLKQNEKFNQHFADPKFELHKRDVHELLEIIAKHDPKSFSFTVDHLKDLGNQYSYELGFSFGLRDIGAYKSIRDPILHKADAAANKVKVDTKLTPTQRHEKLVDIYTDATTDLVNAHRPVFVEKGNRMWQMVASGARGKMEQFRQMTIAPMLMKDAAGNTLANPVRKSYSEGLDVGDYWTSLHGARMGTLQRVEGTSEPGRLTKEIVNVVIPNMIISKDCGTTNGIHMDIHEQDVHDRFLAAPVKVTEDQTIPAGTLIDSHLTSLFKKHKIKQVVVRSPLKCNHGNGLCSKCFGLNENGDLHEIGTNIGVLAGQALGEPATQLAMDSFHTGGVAASRGGASVDKFTRLNQLLELPKVLPNAAVLAKNTGKITKLEKDLATNGWNVFVGKEQHYIPAQRTPTHFAEDGSVPLTVGAEVKKGDPISDGHINPREYLKHTDIHTVQNYLTNELYNGIYKDERVRRRNIETVVRALTNYTQIKDPGDSNYLHGDYALRTVIEEHNRNLPAGDRPIEHQPVLKGAQQMALNSHEDWMARLNFQQLRNTLLEGTAKGWKTDLHGTNPIPAYAFGAEFGLGTPENKHHY